MKVGAGFEVYRATDLSQEKSHILGFDIFYQSQSLFVSVLAYLGHA